MEEAAHTLTPDTQLFRDIFNASPIGIAVENLDGQPLFVNPALCSMLGFSQEELCGKHCVDFSPPEDAEKDWALFQQLRAGSIDHYQLEKRYFRRDGSLVWGNLSISLLKGRQSPLVLAMTEDITAKKTAEEVRFRHSAIVESSEDAIASVNQDGVIQSWNRGAQRIFGYTESEAVGKSVNILVPPERPDEENKILETLKAGGRIDQFETVRVTKIGERINVSLSISPIKDSSDKIAGFSGISRDITERKQAEEALLEVNRTLEAQAKILQSREELLKVFVKNVPAGVAMLDRDMRYLQVSDRFCADYSVDSSQVLGRSHYEVFPDIPYRWEEIHRRALGGETLRADEDRWDRHGGTMWVRWEVLPWRGADGSIGGILILAEDISRRKHMEEALSSLSRKLIESQEQERARIGRELHDNISQRLAMLSIGLERVQNNPSEVVTRLQELREETIAISSEVQALSHELHASKLEYLGVVSGMKSWCKEFSERQKMEIDFRSNVSSALPFEVGLSLFRVLQEALHNVVKHSGVKRVAVQISEQANEVHLTVRDSGNGFEIEAAKRGSGLGLTSMKERVQLVSGQLFIESKLQEGTTLHARVPLSPKVKSALAGGQA
ncbi:MAG TPA: PAS domain S-box protein [Candidatus Acidoferrum sp.]|nr:PAS domain S-box protein [Candidatus Acidoferrum sp.]